MKKPNCSFQDFLKLDIRVGEIKQVGRVENSSKLLLIVIDLGKDYGYVEILSGIAKYIEPKTLLGKKVPVVANLEPKPMAGKLSHGFILMGDLPGHIPRLIFIPEDIEPGTVLC
ncbi:MAG: methionine--tRNA ligase [Patescibacteria group bacterium]